MQMHVRLMWTEHAERETEDPAVRLVPQISLCHSSKTCIEPPKSRPLPCDL